MGLKESFGFGTIDNDIFFYAISTTIAGMGFGIILYNYYKLSSIVGWILLIIGTILANIAHSRLKKKSVKK